MIDPIVGWLEIAEYNNKCAIIIANLVETAWLTIYHWPTEIMYDQVLKFINHDLIEYLVEK